MVGKRLREARLARKLTQTELGLLIGAGKSTISQYENGERDPDTETLRHLSTTLRVSADWLLGLSEDPRIVHVFNADQVHEMAARYEISPDNPRVLEIAAKLLDMGFPPNREDDLLVYARFLAQQEKEHPVKPERG